MLRVALLLALCVVSHGKTISDAKADDNNWCWGIVGDGWCWLTNDGKEDHARLNTGKMQGYKCEWFTGRQSGDYCEHKDGTEIINGVEESNSDPDGYGVGTWIANWVLAKAGQSVGRGQCWDLAKDAIDAARDHGFDIPHMPKYPAMYVWSHHTVTHSNAKPGDIVQLSSWSETHNGYWMNTWTHHTAVVVKAWDGEGLTTYDQNPGPVKKTVYHPQSKTGGSWKIYRIVSTRLLRRYSEGKIPIQGVALTWVAYPAVAVAVVLVVVGAAGVVVGKRLFSGRESSGCRPLVVVAASDDALVQEGDTEL